MSVMDEGDRFLTVDEQKGLFNVLDEEQQKQAFQNFLSQMAQEGRGQFFRAAEETRGPRRKEKRRREEEKPPTAAEKAVRSHARSQ